MRRFAMKHAPTPLAFMIEVGLLIITGALASVFSSELGSIAHYAIWRGGQIVPELWLFWGIFVLTIAFAGVRHWSLFELDRRLTQEMIATVRTQPQSIVLTRYNDFFREAFGRYRRLLDIQFDELTSEQDKEDVKAEFEQVLRDILADICKLAKLFNPHHSSAGYAANIMLYIPNTEFGEKTRDALLLETKFMAENQGFDGLQGVLRLMLALSCDNESDPNQPKKSLRPISLPIPKRVQKPRKAPGKAAHWFVLPGAPRAYVSFLPSQVPNVRTLGAWCRENTAFDEERIERIEAYMEDAADKKRFSSFYALPLPKPSWQREHTPPTSHVIENPRQRLFGVINIESVDPGLFEFAEPAKDFFMFIDPLLIIVSELVDALLELDPQYATGDLRSGSPKIDIVHEHEST